MFGRKKSNLEKLNEKIYSRTAKLRKRERRRIFNSERVLVRENLPDDFLPENEKTNNEDTTKKEAPLAKFYKEPKAETSKAGIIFFVLSVLFFVLSLVGAYFFIITGANSVSNKNISIYVNAPEFVDSGDLFTMQIVIENRNKVALEKAYLVVDYPEGSAAPSGQLENVERVRSGKKERVSRLKLPLGKIDAASRKKGTVRARIFGKKDEMKKVYISLEYRIKGSNAIYALDKTQFVKLLSDAITLDTEGPSEALFGQKQKLKLIVKNNSKSALSSILIKAELPYGVKILESKPDNQNGVWEIEKLDPGEQNEIQLLLKSDGQSGDERVIKFKAGVKSMVEENKIASLYQEAEHVLKISKPFVASSVQIGQDKGEYSVVKPGQTHKGTLTWQNTLPYSLEDLTFAVALSGVLDKYKTSAFKGFYDSLNNLLIWDKATKPDLANVSKGKSGVLQFSIGVLDPKSLADTINPKINIEVNTSARRLSEQNVESSLRSAYNRELRVESFVEFESNSLYFENPLKSAGAFPPKVDSPTVFGVEWKITNTSNLIKDAQVTALLPPNVTWTGVYMPATENISYNSQTGRITWNLGDIKPSSGYSLPARKVYFNLTLIPSVPQIGKTAKLLLNQEFAGKDSYTDTDIKIDLPDLDTKTKDASATENHFKVIR